MKLILPKALVPLPQEATLFFLAGPIKGGGDWQEKAISIIERMAPEAYVACPCRYETNHKLFRYALPGEAEHPFSSQTLWERYYMELASRNRKGCIIFWLPEESATHPRPPETGPYARDTYGELGEWRARLRLESPCPKVVIGAEAGFPGLSVIVKNFWAMVGEGLAIYPTLETTITVAISLKQGLS